MDWLEVTDPALAAQLAPPHRFMDFMRAGNATVLPMVPDELRPEDPADLMPKSFRHLMERLDALQPDRYYASIAILSIWPTRVWPRWTKPASTCSS